MKSDSKGSLEFHVPSKKFVQFVLISSVVVGIICVILGVAVPDPETRPIHNLFWVVLGLSVVPSCGIPWLLLAGHRRSHTRDYYIRYRCAQVLVLTIYSSTLTLLFLLNYQDQFDTICYSVLKVIANVTIFVLLIGIPIHLISIPIIFWRSRRVQSKEIEDNTKRSLKLRISIFLLWAAVTFQAFVFGMVFGWFGLDDYNSRVISCSPFFRADMEQ